MLWLKKFFTSTPVAKDPALVKANEIVNSAGRMRCETSNEIRSHLHQNPIEYTAREYTSLAAALDALEAHATQITVNRTVLSKLRDISSPDDSIQSDDAIKSRIAHLASILLIDI